MLKGIGIVRLLVFCMVGWNMYSCEDSTSALLHQAEKAMGNTDSVNMILQEVKSPESLTGKQLADYCSLQAEMMFRSYKFRQADSLIRYTIEYYQHTEDTVKYYRFLFRAGITNYRLENVEQALLYFEQTLALISINDVGKRGTIFNWMGYCYSKAEDYSKAIEMFHEAAKCRVESELEYLWVTDWDIAYTYRLAKNYDSSLVYYNKAIAGITPENRRTKSRAYNDLCELFVERGDYRQAVLYADSSILYKASREDVPLFNLAKARIFMNLNQRDSVAKYVKISIQSPDQFLAAAAYRYMAEYEWRSYRYKDTYHALRNYEHHFEAIKSNIETNILQQKYEEERLKNENNQLKLAKRGQEIYMLMIGIVFLLITGLFGTGYFLNRKKRLLENHRLKEKELKDQATMMEKNNLLLKKEHELSVLREKAANFRELLFKKMTVSQKIPSLDESHVEAEYNKKIVLTEQDWNELIRTVDDAYGGFVDKLRQRCPSLSQNDIGFCCLVKIKVNIKDLSDIYCISRAGITKRKTRMKKDKFGIDDNQITLDDFLQDI